MKMADVGTSI